MAEMREEILNEPRETGDSVVAVCQRRGVSRSMFYVYKRRYEVAGAAGLEPISKRPINTPNRIDPDLEDLICRMRKDHPRWGARRIRAELTRSGVGSPATSTIHQTLKRNHLVLEHPNRKPKSLLRRFVHEHPNDLWQLDATQVKLGNRTRPYVLSILDDHARFLLATKIGNFPTAEAAWDCFEQAARRYGLPKQVLSDNQSTFTGRFLGYKTAFELKLKALGISYINGRPRHPQTQGKIERFHRTLKEWLEDEGGAKDLSDLERKLGAMRRHYNLERPNQALDESTPAERYSRSPRIYKPLAQMTPHYPEGSIVRKADRRGNLCYDVNVIQLERRWAGHTVRVVPKGGRLLIYFGDELLRDVAHLRDGGRHPLRTLPRPQ